MLADDLKEKGCKIKEVIANRDGSLDVEVKTPDGILHRHIPNDVTNPDYQLAYGWLTAGA